MIKKQLPKEQKCIDELHFKKFWLLNSLSLLYLTVKMLQVEKKKEKTMCNTGLRQVSLDGCRFTIFSPKLNKHHGM